MWQLTDEEKRTKLIGLRDEILQCTKCSARIDARRPVPWQINDINSPVIFHGRNPGYTEDMEGKPFVGAGGRVLNKHLTRNVIARKWVNIGNLICCYTRNDRMPLWSEVRVCFPFIVRYLQVLQPRLIVLMGTLTIEAYTNEEEVRLTYGKLMKHKRGFHMVSCPHPGSVLYNKGKRLGNFVAAFDFCCQQARLVLENKL